MVKLYIVGGYVRDKILGIKSNDLDYAVEANSYIEMKNYINENHTIIYPKPQYLTIRAKDKSNAVCDFVLCRKEAYYDGRYPSHTEPATIIDDLSRRDFTMNSIAIDEKGIYLDPFNGINDIKSRCIRCVGSAKERFTEDSLRMIRAIRFHIILGFSLDSEIVWCLHSKELIDKLEIISKDRLRYELNKCFEKDTYKTLLVFNQFPTLQKIIFNSIKLKPIIF